MSHGSTLDYLVIMALLIYNAVLSNLPRQLNNHLHLCSPSTSNPHEGRLNQHPTGGSDDSETWSSHMSLTTL